MTTDQAPTVPKPVTYRGYIIHQYNSIVPGAGYWIQKGGRCVAMYQLTVEAAKKTIDMLAG